MTDKYYPPEFQQRNFHCPCCMVYANQLWFEARAVDTRQAIPTQYLFSQCSHCFSFSIWSDKGDLLWPIMSSIALPSPDLPEPCRIDFLEARMVFPYSPRSAAALLRLAIQKLMQILGEKGKDLNSDIKSLVSQGLSPGVQKALDICRVVGNNAVHPGEIDISDTPEIAYRLFALVNFITEDRITRPRQIEELYNKLPEGAKKAIEERDNKVKPTG